MHLKLSKTGRRSILLCSAVLALVVTTVNAADNDYRARFQAAKRAKDNNQAEAILKEWKAAHSDDPEYYIAAANFVLSQESGLTISRKKTAPGDFPLSDQKSGRAVGSISSGPSAAGFKQAIDLLKVAISKAPARIDIYLGLATLHRDSGVPGEVLSDLSAMATYANEHPKALLYKDGESYPEPAKENLSHAISNFAHHYFELQTKEGDETFHRLAELDVKAFPDCEYGYNLMGVYYSTIDRNPPRALENYEKCLKLVPSDSLVWTNVGVVRKMAGQPKEAAKAFNKVIALDNDPDCVQQAKEELAKLK